MFAICECLWTLTSAKRPNVLSSIKSHSLTDKKLSHLYNDASKEEHQQQTDLAWEWHDMFMDKVLVVLSSGVFLLDDVLTEWVHIR